MNKILSLIISNIKEFNFKEFINSNDVTREKNLSENDILNSPRLMYDFFSSIFLNHTISIEEIKDAQNKSLKILEICRQNDIKILCNTDNNYPATLKEINDAPFLLFYKGNIKILNDHICTAVIGTRTPTPHGIRTATRFGEVLASNNILVVSGLAKGCDSAAHNGCLNKNGHTAAVLATGLDSIYPKENIDLAERIVSLNGCLISEYPPCNPINRRNFVKRDRLVSGLSKGIIVVEAALKSGTMHTVKFAKKQNRFIGVYKHSEKFKDLNQVSGNLNLLSDTNVFPLRDPTSIMNFINLLKSSGLILSLKNEYKNDLFNNQGGN